MAKIALTPMGQKRLQTPIRERLGQRYVQPFGTIPYVSGQATPLQLLKVGVLGWLDLHFTGTLSYTQAAGAAAWSATSGFPWNLIQLATLKVGNNGNFDQSLTGYGMYLRELFTHPGLTQQGYAYQATLPPANSGTSSVSGQETWSWRYRLPVVLSEDDPQGLLFLQSQASTAYLNVTFNPLTSIVTIPSGSSGTLTGQLNVTGYGFALGALTATDLSVAHVQEEVPYALPAGVTSAQVPLVVGEIVQRMFLEAYVGGQPDTTGQVALSSVEVQVGVSRQEKWTADELRFSNSLRDRADLPNGVWVINWAELGGTQYRDWRLTPQAWLNLGFSAPVPANAQLYILYEFQRLFGPLA